MYAFPFVWFRFLLRADLRGYTADELFLDAGDFYRALFDCHRDLFRQWHTHRERVAEIEHQFLAFQHGAISDTLNFQYFQKSLGHAENRVLYEPPQRSPKRL